jgi:DNA-binding NarL/FixJ family response regulator
VLVAEDEALIVEELRERLSRNGMHVVSAVDSADAVVPETLRTTPDVILMDVRLKGTRDGIEAAADIRQCCDTPIVYVTAHSDRGTLERAKETSPYGYVLKPFHERELLVAIEMAVDRHARERAAPQSDPMTAAARTRYDALTPRQREVFAYIARGWINRQVAEALGLSERTVKAHRAQIMERLEVDSLADLVRLAERVGL